MEDLIPKEQDGCIICTIFPVPDNCHVQPCGHRLGCWSCVQDGLDTLRNCWFCREPVACIMRDGTGEMFVLKLRLDKNLFAGREPRLVTPVERQVMRRAYIYHHRLFSQHVGSNAVSGYREVTPKRFTHDLALQHRARAFLRRELRVFVRISMGLRFSDHCPRVVQQVESMIQCFLLMLKKWDLKGCSGAAEEVVRSRLHLALPKMREGPTVVKLFIHELRAFLMSPYTRLGDWDASVQYNEPRGVLAPVPPIVDDPQGNTAFEETPSFQAQASIDWEAHMKFLAEEDAPLETPSGTARDDAAPTFGGAGALGQPNPYVSRITVEYHESPSFSNSSAYAARDRRLQGRAAEANHDPNQAAQGPSPQEMARSRIELEAGLIEQNSSTDSYPDWARQMLAQGVSLEEVQQRVAWFRSERAAPRRTTVNAAVEERQRMIWNEANARSIENPPAATSNHIPGAVTEGTPAEEVGAAFWRRARHEMSQWPITAAAEAAAQVGQAAPLPSHVEGTLQRHYLTRSVARESAQRSTDIDTSGPLRTHHHVLNTTPSRDLLHAGAAHEAALTIQRRPDMWPRPSQGGSPSSGYPEVAGNLGRANRQRGNRTTQGRLSTINARRGAAQDHVDQRARTGAGITRPS